MCQTIRYKNANGICARTTSHPEWSENFPWITYINGSAGRHFATFEDADQYLKGHGFKQLPRNDNVTFETTNQSSS